MNESENIEMFNLHIRLCIFSNSKYNIIVFMYIKKRKRFYTNIKKLLPLHQYI